MDFTLTGEDFTYVDLDYITKVLYGKYKVIIDRLEFDFEYDQK